MCWDCRLSEWSWPEVWPTFDLSAPDGTAVDLVMAMTVDDLDLCGGP